jgi:hypothetical protein
MQCVRLWTPTIFILILFCHFGVFQEFLGDFEGPANIAVTIPHEASPIDTTEVDGQDDSMSMRSPRIKTGKFKFLVLILIGIVGITSGFCFFQTVRSRY